MTKVAMTQEGRLKLEEDLSRMKGKEMREVLAALSDAREKGDISENSEYDAAKEAFDMLNLRIQKLDAILKNSYVLNRESVDISSVQILTKVRIMNLKNKKELIYTIVPENEIDLKNCKISHSSPIGKGLIGKCVGDTVKISVPAGEMEFQIMDISL